MKSIIRRMFLFIVLATLSANGVGDPTPPIDIERRRIDTTEMVLREYTGFDWNIGSAMEEVAAYMHTAGQTGPLVCLHHDSPDQSASDRTLVGFFVTGDVATPPAFMRQTIPAHEAAVVRVEGRFGLSREYNTTLRDWASANGFRPDGPVTEVYESVSGADVTLEIRLPILRNESKSVDKHSPRPDLTSRPTTSDNATDIIPDWPIPTSDDRIWLGEVADRLRVILAVVEKNYTTDTPQPADQEDRLTGLRERLPQVIARIGSLNTANRDAAATIVGRDVPVNAVVVAERKAVLTELDKIIVRGHLKRLTADELAAQTANVFQRIRGVLIRKPIQPSNARADETEIDGPEPVLVPSERK